MACVWSEGEWSIFRNDEAEYGKGHCLRHMCKDDKDGLCSCRTSKCVDCNVTVPDTVRGFFSLVAWDK